MHLYNNHFAISTIFIGIYIHKYIKRYWQMLEIRALVICVYLYILRVCLLASSKQRSCVWKFKYGRLLLPTIPHNVIWWIIKGSYSNELSADNPISLNCQFLSVTTNIYPRFIIYNMFNFTRFAESHFKSPLLLPWSFILCS